MGAVAFDTLKYAKKLQNAGFTDQQAQIQAETLAEILESNMASKRDVTEIHERIENVRAGLTKDIEATNERIENVRAELTRDIENVRIDLKRDINEQSMKLTIRLGGMLVICVTILAALMKLF